MRYQDQVIRATSKSVEDLFRNARAMPEDKIEWKPLDKGRSVLDQLQECAQAPIWYVSMLESRKAPEFDEDTRKKAGEERQQWKTIDECEKVCGENSERLAELIDTFPDEDLEIMITLPFGDGMVVSMADVMMFQYWNNVYHIGQLSYIQTLYGDMEMH